MILEEATYEAFRYFPSNLGPNSHKPIIAACELCGAFRVLTKNGYSTFCHLCAHQKSGTRIKRICKTCGKKFEVKPSVVKDGNGKYCCKKCKDEGHSGGNNPNFGKRGDEMPNYRGGWRIRHARAKAKRIRELGYILLAPLKKGEAGHHVTNEYVIGIPNVVHASFSGHSTRKHRTLVLQWLKVNDRKKYKIVLCVLAKEPLKNKDISTNTS